MSIWEKYRAIQSQSAEDMSEKERQAEIGRKIEQKNREMDQWVAARRTALINEEASRKAEAMQLFQSSNTLEMLKDIANHIPGATVKVEDKSGHGYLSASVQWQRKVDAHFLDTDKHTTRQIVYGVVVQFGDPTPNNPTGNLYVDGSRHTDNLEDQIVEVLGRELANTGKPIGIISKPRYDEKNASVSERKET